jgi:hypothetical protein
MGVRPDYQTGRLRARDNLKWPWTAVIPVCYGATMPRERPSPPSPQHPEDVFGFTEKEQLYDRVTNERFEELIGDERTTIHEITEDCNNYGEFLFVHTSRPVGERRASVTFYGAGFHELRERWFVDQWFFYQANNFPDRLSQTVSKEEAAQMIKRRREAIAPYVSNKPQSSRAKLFEMLAELTDDDGAIAEMEDLGEVADWLAGDLE